MHCVIFVLLLLAPAASLEIVCGDYHNCVLERGQVAMKCWGRNGQRQLGYSDTNDRGDSANEMGADLPFVHIGTGFIVEDMSLGLDHSCAMSDDRAMKCFGDNAYSQLGFDGVTTTGDALPFLEFGVDFNLSKIAVGGYLTCALSTDGKLKCFGDNIYGQCGAGTTTDPISGPPSQINAIDFGTNFTPVDVQSFGDHGCVLSQQRTVKCFGDNSRGQLGYGDTTQRGKTPESMGDGLPIVDLGSDFIVAAIATGYWHTCALSTTKTVKCWGSNTYGQCGTPRSTETGDNLPVLEFGAGFVPLQLALGGYHTCILSETAALICFGNNKEGQLGIGSTSNVDTPSTLSGIDLGTDFVPRQVAAGWEHNCAVSTTDAIKCWGRNQYGQLGLGHTDDMGDEPNEMGDNLPFVDVAWPAPTTASPTSPAPTTAVPTTTTANPTTTATPTTAVLTTTATPTKTAQTTASPTTAVPTATTVPATTEVAIAIEYRVTIDVRSVSCADILVTVVTVIDAELPPQVTVEEVECGDDDDDDISTAVLLIAVAADVQLDSDDIESTLREAMVEEYGEDVVDVDVEEEETRQSSQSDNFVAIVAGVAGGAVLCFICVCALIYCGCRRRRRTQVQPPPPQPQRQHAPEVGAQQWVYATQNIEMVAQPGVVAVAPLLSVANKKQPNVRAAAAEQKDDHGESDSEQLYGGGAPTAMGAITAMQAYGEDDDDEEGEELFAVMKPPTTATAAGTMTKSGTSIYNYSGYRQTPNHIKTKNTTKMTRNDATKR